MSMMRICVPRYEQSATISLVPTRDFSCPSMPARAEDSAGTHYSSFAFGNGGSPASSPVSLALSTSKQYKACRGVHIGSGSGVAGAVMESAGVGAVVRGGVRSSGGCWCCIVILRVRST